MLIYQTARPLKALRGPISTILYACTTRIRATLMALDDGRLPGASCMAPAINLLSGPRSKLKLSAEW